MLMPFSKKSKISALNSMANHEPAERHGMGGPCSATNGVRESQTVSGATSDFIKAACVPRRAAHGSGTLVEAEKIRQANLEVATASIYAASVLGDEQIVRGFVRAHPGLATEKGGPYAWDALTYLCFSRYLRLDRRRADDFLGAARALLDAGASASTGFFEPEHQPQPDFECVLYGAAGIAHDPDLTWLLLERGADPNDGEVAYHTPEGYDNRALTVLVESRKLTADTLATMLLRKADWHDYDGIQLLLEHGADPNRSTPWGITALHQAVRRDNALQ